MEVFLKELDQLGIDIENKRLTNISKKINGKLTYLISRRKYYLKLESFEEAQAIQAEIKQLKQYSKKLNYMKNDLMDKKLEKKSEVEKIKTPGLKQGKEQLNKSNYSSKEESDKRINEIKLSSNQTEIIYYIEHGCVDIFNSNYELKDIIETYKYFVQNSNLKHYTNQFNKVTEYILLKIKKLSNLEKSKYLYILKDTLRQIRKPNKELSKNFLKKVDENIEQCKYQKVIEYQLENDYHMYIEKLQQNSGFSKQESYLILLEQLGKKLNQVNLEEIGKIIKLFSLIKIEENDNVLISEINKIVSKYYNIIEKYGNTHLAGAPSVIKEKLEDILHLRNIIDFKTSDFLKNYKMLSRIIFESKDLEELSELLKINPELINTINGKQEYYMDMLLDLYINQIINGKHYYLEEVINVFIKQAGIDMDSNLKYCLIDNIQKTLEEYSDIKELVPILSNLLCKLDNIILQKELEVNNQEKLCLHKAQKIPNKEFSNMINRFIVTIDQEDTKYFENAISCDKLENGYRIGYYVSDIIDFLPNDLILQSNDLRHNIFKNQLNRNNKYILKEKKVRAVIAFTLYVNSKLEIEDFVVERARIKVKDNLTFREVTEILNKDDKDNKMFNNLSRINNVARIMQRKRNPSQKLKPYMKFIPEIQKEFTMFLNKYIAANASLESIPLIYKNQLPKSCHTVCGLFGGNCYKCKSIEEIVNETSFNKVSYSPVNRGNDNFEQQAYTQITSPTRNLVSLINQILIIQGYIEPKHFKYKDQIPEVEKILSLVHHYNYK